MKTIAIGDTHGRDDWEKIVKKNAADKIVFMGDYFDSKDNKVSAAFQIYNFKNILQYKRENMDKVVLLFGNHDFHYISGDPNERYSGYQHLHSIEISQVIKEAINEGLLQMCYINDIYLFSHAGVTNTWLNQYWDGIDPIDVTINDLFKYKPKSFVFQMGRNWSETGDDVCQSPIWVRPRSLFADGIDGYKFVVGHTTANKISHVGEIILIDTLGTSGEFLVIEDGVTRSEYV